jgi:spore maturation protein CgeB
VRRIPFIYVPCRKVFKDGEHLVWYRDEDEALDMIAQWLQRDGDRAKIAAGGHAEVMQYHQYYHRVARILHWLQVGVPRWQNDARWLPPVSQESSRQA